MPRDTTKHDPRVDDQLKAETRPLTTGAPVEGHSRQDRLQEAPTDDEPRLDPAVRPGATRAASMSDEEAWIRTTLAGALSEAVFPADRNDLIRHLGDPDGRDDLTTRLRMLPADRTFTGVEDVLRSLGGTAADVSGPRTGT